MSWALLYLLETDGMIMEGNGGGGERKGKKSQKDWSRQNFPMEISDGDS